MEKPLKQGQKLKPCVVPKKGDPKYCKLLSAVLQSNGQIQLAFQMMSGKEFVVFKRRAKDPFYVFTTCPFCGTSLRHPEKA